MSGVPRRTWKYLVVFFAGVGLILLGTVGWSTAQPGMSRLFGLGPQPSPPLVVGTNVWPGYEPLYLARALGKYDGADIRLVEFTSATQVIRAFRNGLINVAAFTLDEAIVVRRSMPDLRVFLITDISDGGDAIIAQPEFQGMSDLSGHSVGVEGTALGAFFLGRALEISGLRSDEVVVVPLSVDEHYRAFTEGRIDAVVTFEPVVGELVREGANVVFDSSEIPGEIMDVMVARTTTLETSAHLVSRLVDGWFDAVAYLESEPREAGSLLAPRLRIPPDDVLESYSGLELPSRSRNTQLMGDPGLSPLEDLARRLMETMVRFGQLEQPIPVADMSFPDMVRGPDGR